MPAGWRSYPPTAQPPTHPAPPLLHAPAAGVSLILLSVVLMGSVISMGFLTQGVTLGLFWREVALGFVYSALAAAASSVVAGCLVMVRSAHDEVRDSSAALALKAGQLISE